MYAIRQKSYIAYFDYTHNQHSTKLNVKFRLLMQFIVARFYSDLNIRIAFVNITNWRRDSIKSIKHVIIEILLCAVSDD